MDSAGTLLSMLIDVAMLRPSWALIFAPLARTGSIHARSVRIASADTVTVLMPVSSNFAHLHGGRGRDGVAARKS